MSEEAETISTTTRDNQGWSTDLVTNQSYSISLECVMTDDRPSNALSYWKLRDKKRNRELVEWKRKYLYNDVEETGFAIITSISDSASSEEYITFSMTLKGFGKPNEITNHSGGDVDYPDANITIGGQSDKNFVFVQNTSSTVWEITHNLYKFPSVTVVDQLGNIIYGEIQYIDLNSIRITFSSASIGKVYLN